MLSSLGCFEKIPSFHKKIITKPLLCVKHYNCALGLFLPSESLYSLVDVNVSLFIKMLCIIKLLYVL